MSFKSFLEKYANEVNNVGVALGTIISGIALPSAERDKVLAVINTLDQAAANILNGLGDVKETTVKISKSDLDAALKAALPGLVDEMLPSDDEFKKLIADEVTAQLAAAKAATDAPKA